MKIQTWNDAREAKLELDKRLRNARELREDYEYQWSFNERILQNTRGYYQDGEEVSLAFDAEAELFGYENDKTIGINYTFKNLRFIHSQLSSNPPTVVARPNSNDADDRRKADSADRLIRYAIRQYKMQERFDKATLNCLYYGSAFIKIIMDPTKGDLVKVEDDGTVIMEGDISVTTPSPWNIYVDPDADCWDDVTYVIEKMFIPWEEALFQFGEDKKDILKKARKEHVVSGKSAGEKGSDSAINSKKYDVVEIYQYWEKGLPRNGMQGRFCYHLEDGTPLTDVVFNPHSFVSPESRTGVKQAQLPYHCITDLDIPNTVWGKATVDYEAGLQETHNRMLNVMLDNMKAHAVARIILPEGAEIADDSITNNPMDIIKITGGLGQAPKYMDPMPWPQSFNDMMMTVKQGIDDSAGVNDAMFGEIKRETSGFSLQYATNQGNMIRRRLFNKYVLLVESVYKTYLNLIREHWTTPKQIRVLGTEKAFQTFDIDNTDVDGGFDLVVEYGASLSLDPTTRREEILTLMPIFEKAGVSTRTILGMLKLNELEGLYDLIKMAEDRQYEVFKEMIDTGTYVKPEELEDHENMLAYAYRYRMTSEFKYLDNESKQLVEQHIRDREQFMTQAPMAAPGGAADPGLADPTAGMTGGVPDVTQLGALLGGGNSGDLT